MRKSTKTAHEKKLELAEESKPAYGIYIDGGSLEKLAEAISLVGPLMLDIVNSKCEEKTKRNALDIIKNSVPRVDNAYISNVNIEM